MTAALFYQAVTAAMTQNTTRVKMVVREHTPEARVASLPFLARVGAM